MLGVAAQRIVHPIRKPRNNADECHCAETRRDGAFRAICFVAPLARGACHGRRVASRISSRKASVAATRGLFRGSYIVLTDALRFLLNVAFGLVVYTALLRFIMQWMRAPFRNPVGQAVTVLTDWAVKPLRKVLHGFGGYDWASLVAAWLLPL